MKKQIAEQETSLVVEWLKLWAPNARLEGLGSIPGQGTRSHMPQQKIVCHN